MNIGYMINRTNRICMSLVCETSEPYRASVRVEAELLSEELRAELHDLRLMESVGNSPLLRQAATAEIALVEALKGQLLRAETGRLQGISSSPGDFAGRPPPSAF